jgi:hypothetical protein
MLFDRNGTSPRIDPSAKVAPSAQLVGGRHDRGSLLCRRRRRDRERRPAARARQGGDRSRWQRPRLGRRSEPRRSAAPRATSPGSSMPSKPPVSSPRSPHPSDRRATVVSLTGRGRRTATAWQGEYRRLASLLFHDLGARDRGHFVAALEHVLEKLRASTSAPPDKPQARRRQPKGQQRPLSPANRVRAIEGGCVIVATRRSPGAQRVPIETGP